MTETFNVRMFRRLCEETLTTQVFIKFNDFEIIKFYSVKIQKCGENCFTTFLH